MANRRPLTENAQAKRRQVVEAAARLFAERSFSTVSMEDVAEAAGLAKPTLYHYFPGKAQILHEIHMQFIFPLLETARERATSGMPATDELRAIVHDVLFLSAEKAGYLRTFNEHLRDLEPEAYLEVAGHRDEYRDIVEAAIRRGVDNGEFTVEDPRIAALSMLGALVWSYQWLRGDKPRSIADVAESIWRMFLFGLEGPNTAGSDSKRTPRRSPVSTGRSPSRVRSDGS
jgi:TetR/AcrR family transcriptional regulator, cholesterol catabolism regulator